MKELFLIAKSLGYSAVFLCGNYNFYKKLGFRPSYIYDIFHINDSHKNAEWCMVRELAEGFIDSVEGMIDIE